MGDLVALPGDLVALDLLVLNGNTSAPSYDLCVNLK